MFRWPKEVPVLVADDICRKKFEIGSRRCLIGWRAQIFGALDVSVGREAKMFTKIEDAIYREIQSVTIPGNPYSIRQRGNAFFNDRAPRQAVAKVWNRAMARLGYTEGNPEAGYVKRHPITQGA